MTDNDPYQRSYLKFGVTGLTTAVGRARLMLWVTEASADGPRVYQTSTAWNESTITYANRPSVVSGALDDEGPLATGTWVSYTVTPAVEGNGRISFLLAATSNDGVSFSSRESSSPPRLVVTADAPAPAPVCGDGACDGTETCSTCPGDCGACSGACVPPGGARVEYSVRPQPSVTRPSTVGGSYIDPTFGTKIIRVTTVGNSMHGYSYWSAFNSSSTRFVANKGGVPTLYSLDPATDAIADLGALFPSGLGCDWQDVAWSHADPNILFCHTRSSKRLYTMDVRTRATTLVKDFSADLSASTDQELWQMSVDHADDAFRDVYVVKMPVICQ